MDKEDRNISTTSGHKTPFSFEAYPSSRAKIPVRRPKLDSTLWVRIPYESEEDYEDVSYIQITYEEVIRSLSIVHERHWVLWVKMGHAPTGLHVDYHDIEWYDFQRIQIHDLVSHGLKPYH